MRAGLYCLIGLVFGGLVAGLVAHYYGAKSREPSVSVLPKDEDVTLEKIHHVAIRNGAKEWTLDAESAGYAEAEKRTALSQIAATFFLQDGRTIHLTSHKGVLMMDTKDMEVTGDVVARSGPYALNTERLVYDHDKRAISTDTPVVVKGEGVNLRGKRMVFSLRTERALLTGDVEAVFQGFDLL
jgi:LPS export ABC transporter protein LptC